MFENKRKSRRRAVRYTAWMRRNDELEGCALFDISETGARIEVEDCGAIPEQFVLLLSGNGKARRTCRVVWRKPYQIGVKFEKPLAADDRAKLVVKSDHIPLATADDAPPLAAGDIAPSEKTEA